MPAQPDELPPIPNRIYFTIGDVAKLCDVQTHVLRYWEREFPQLGAVQRRGNRRYYQRKDVMLVRQIRSLLYDKLYTVAGARKRLSDKDMKEDTTQSMLVVKQLIVELEEVLHDLRA